MSKIITLILLLNLIDFLTSRTIKRYRVGGIFHSYQQKKAFDETITDLNRINEGLIPFELIPDSTIFDENETFEIFKHTCRLLQKGIIGMFGPSSLYSATYIEAMCDTKEIPRFETHWNPRLQRSNAFVNMHPYPAKLAELLKELVLKYDWKEMIILYEDNDSILRLKEIILLSGVMKRKVMLRQLECDLSGNFRPFLNAVKQMKIKNFVLDCRINLLKDILIQAQQVGLMTEQYQFIITNMDMHTVDLLPFQYAGTNITGIRMFDPEEIKVVDLANDIFNEECFHGGCLNQNSWNIELQTALTVDAVNLFYETLTELNPEIFEFAVKPIFCNSSDYWEHGYTIHNSIKKKRSNGITGQIVFDNEGFRSEFYLELTYLSQSGVISIGYWNNTLKSWEITRPYTPPSKSEPGANNLFNRTFRILTALTPPYGMLKQETVPLEGNDRYEGFSIDLIQDLAEMLHFNYTFMLQEDQANGNYNRTTKQWNGMIRQILDGNADLAITDLTITSEREEAVDFTAPFMTLGISILYKKPEPVAPSLFMFASPFTGSVWIMLGVAYFVVSVALFVMGRLSPSEWTNPYPCVEEPEFLINQFTMKNCLWHTLGSLMQQGSDLGPVGLSTRAASGIWWFFTLIMVSTYTANLAACLTVTTYVTSFNNIEELAGQTEIPYGAKLDGATANYFRDSNISAYRNIWKYMIKHPENMVQANEEGVERVLKDNYAYLMESTTIEYVVERQCSLARVGGLLGDKGYGIAMLKNSPYRSELTKSILKLQESGRLTDLKIKWWKEKRGGGTCMAKSESSEATPLSLKNIGGVFVVLFAGTFLGMALALFELYLKILRRAKKYKISVKEEFTKEMKFFFKFKRNVKDFNYCISDSQNQLFKINKDQK